VATAGLRVGAMEYNPPLYYLPCLPFVEDISKAQIKEGFTRDDLIHLLRFTNIAYLFLFYLCWIYFIIPKLVPNWRGAAAASLVLLGFPGFQKLGAMTHPDNLVVGLSSLGLATWLWFRKRPSRTGWKDWAGIAGFGLLVGLLGMTRPFAAAPVFVLSLAGLIALIRERGIFSWAFFSRATLLTMLVGTLSLSWYVYRWQEVGTFRAGYNERWMGPFREYRDDLDRVHYFTSFYFADLNKALATMGSPRSPTTCRTAFRPSRTRNSGATSGFISRLQNIVPRGSVGPSACSS
jgi:hypothetical protein